jgi:hypothetical protein
VTAEYEVSTKYTPLRFFFIPTFQIFFGLTNGRLPGDEASKDATA